MQIKATMKYYLILVRMASIKISTNNKRWRGCGEKGTLLYCWWECKLMHPLWRTVWRFLKKLKIELPYDPAIPLLGLYPEKKQGPKRYMQPNVHCSTVYNSVCVYIYTHDIFIHSSVDGHLGCFHVLTIVNTHRDIHTMEYYSAIKKNEIRPFAATWMDLECHTEWSQSDRGEYDIPYMWNLKRNNTNKLTYETERDSQT